MDAERLNYLRDTGRPESQIQVVEAYFKEQGMFHARGAPEAAYSDTLSLDLSTVVPSMAGPARPQDRVNLPEVRKSFAEALPKMKVAAQSAKKPAPVPSTKTIPLHADGPTTTVQLAPGAVKDGSVVIAAITSCTNTSNPDVMMPAG